MFNREDNRAFEVSSLLRPRLNDKDRSRLESRICMNELERALKSSGKDKGPGPDGMNFRCLKKIWPVIKES